MIRELLQAVLGHNEIQDTEGEPRLPMINPCPPGYVLRNVGGVFPVCPRGSSESGRCSSEEIPDGPG